MIVLDSWHIDDEPETRLHVLQELVAVWAVHLSRSFRLIRGA